jgi:hypothetical protein
MTVVMVKEVKCRSIRLASALIQRAKSGALVFGSFAQDDAAFFFVESCGDAGEERPQVPGAAKENRRSVRLASALIQRAKSGALEFGSFAQDDRVFFFC